MVCVDGTDTDGVPRDADELAWQCFKTYRERGFPDACNHLESGSLAVIDQSRRQFYLSRDWIGHYPMFYSFRNVETGTAMAFSNWRNHLLQWQENPEFDIEAVRAHARHGHRHGSRTLFKKLFMIPPGLCLHVPILNKTTESTVELRRWYSPSLKTSTNSYGSTIDRFRKTLDAAIASRMRGDGNNIVMLSSGSDSTLLLDRLTTICGKPVKTVTYGYTTSPQPENPLARTIANAYGTDHTEIMLDPAESTVEDLTYALWTSYVPLGVASMALECRPLLRTLQEIHPSGGALFWGYEHGFHTPNLRWQELLAYPVYVYAKPLWSLASHMPVVGRRIAPDLGYMFSPSYSTYASRMTAQEASVHLASVRSLLSQASTLGEVWNVKHFSRDLGMAETMMLAHRALWKPFSLAFPYHDKAFMEFNASTPFRHRFKMNFRQMLKSGYVDSKHLVLAARENGSGIKGAGLLGNNWGAYETFLPVACNSPFGEAISEIVTNLRYDEGSQDEDARWFRKNQGSFPTEGDEKIVIACGQRLLHILRIASIELTYRMFVEQHSFLEPPTLKTAEKRLAGYPESRQ